MTDVGLPAGRARTWAACFASVEEQLCERPLRISDLVGEDVVDVVPHPHRGGFVLRFGSGDKLFIPTGVALDAAGLAVIEP